MSISSKIFSLNSLDELPEVATAILDYAQGYTFFAFEGEMGAGKTTLIKQLCLSLGVKDHVSSPTFSIVNEYQSERGTIFHFDFYRIKSEVEAFDMGFEEYFYADALCLVEWPSKIASLLPKRRVEVSLEKTSFNGRNVEVRRV